MELTELELSGGPLSAGEGIQQMIRHGSILADTTIPGTILFNTDPSTIATSITTFPGSTAELAHHGPPPTIPVRQSYLEALMAEVDASDMSDLIGLGLVAEEVDDAEWELTSPELGALGIGEPGAEPDFAVPDQHLHGLPVSWDLSRRPNILTPARYTRSRDVWVR